MRFSPKQRREELGLFNIAEVSHELGVCQQRLYYLIRADQLPSPTFAIGARMYYRESELEELMKSLKEQE
jgi:predicted DNA-binding transcriptional regulator AlpA